jgi:hypothetical protein
MFETETTHNRRLVFTNSVKGFHGGEGHAELRTTSRCQR